MIHHASLGINDLKRARAFYDPIMQLLGLRVLGEKDESVDYGVGEFHRLALANGGSDGGAPGVRPKYNDHYYGAFVLDPDGNEIEAVTFSSR